MSTMDKLHDEQWNQNQYYQNIQPFKQDFLGDVQTNDGQYFPYPPPDSWSTSLGEGSFSHSLEWPYATIQPLGPTAYNQQALPCCNCQEMRAV